MSTVGSSHHVKMGTSDHVVDIGPFDPAGIFALALSSQRIFRNPLHLLMY